MNQSNSCILNNIDSCEEKNTEINKNEPMSLHSDLNESLLNNDSIECNQQNIQLEINLNNHEIKKPLEKIEELYDECPICFDLLDTTQEVCTLECNHKFHLECLIDWYRRPNSNYKCPNCYVHRDIILIENTRKVIPKENKKVKQIYKNTNKKCVIS